MKDCKDWPEFQACLPLFEAGARKFRDNIEGQYRFLFSDIKASLDQDGKRTMWRSSMYGTHVAATALSALATRFGYIAAPEQVYGPADNDWAMVITGVLPPPTT